SRSSPPTSCRSPTSTRLPWDHPGTLGGRGTACVLLIPGGAVDQIPQGLAREPAAHVLSEERDALVIVARQEARHVRRQDHVVARVERMPGPRRLLGEQVDGGTGDNAGAERGGPRGFVARSPAS